MRYTNKIVLLLLLGLPVMGFSQSEREISPEEIRQSLLENNPALKAGEMEVVQAEAMFRETRSLFLPGISASYNAMTGDLPLMVFGSKINQGAVSESDFMPSRLNDPGRYTNYQTKVELRQPIVQPAGWAQRDGLENAQRAATYKFQNSRDGMLHAADMLYLQLQFLYRRKEALEEIKSLVERNRSFVNDQYGQGLTPRADLLAVEVRILEIEDQLLSVEKGISMTSDHLSQLMGSDPEGVFRPAQRLELNEINGELQAELSENRPDLMAVQMNIRALEDFKKAEERAILPQLNGFASYEWNNDALLPSGGNGYLLGLSLSWNLFDGGNRSARKQKAEAEYQAARWNYAHKLSESKTEIRDATRNLIQAQNRLQLTESALEYAEEALRLRTERFEEGIERTPDLIRAEVQYSEKTMEHFGAIFEHNLQVLELKFLSR